MPPLKRIGGWSNREVDLGGLTAPRWTKRPHMGPFNSVAPEPLSQYPGDEVYRQHDLSYGRMSNPYFNYNAADEALLRSGQNEWPDVLAKGVFFGKKALDLYNVPQLYKGGTFSPMKAVDSVLPRPMRSYSGTGTYDAAAVPFREFRSDAGNWRVDEVPRRARKRDSYVQVMGSDLYPGKRPPGHGGLGPGGTRSGARAKLHAEVRYERT